MPAVLLEAVAAPDVKYTLPPVMLAAVVEPAENTMRPPAALEAVPTIRLIEPVGKFVESAH